METYHTTSTAATQELGGRLAQALLARRHRDAARGATVVLLSGDLGAGKTTLAQGLLAAVGAEGPYASPTFTIVRTYEVKVKSQKSKVKSSAVLQNAEQLTTHNTQLATVYHVDPYRVTVDDRDAIGWDEMLADDHALMLVEWPEIMEDHLPEGAVRVRCEHGTTENERTITIDGVVL